LAEDSRKDRYFAMVKFRGNNFLFLLEYDFRRIVTLIEVRIFNPKTIAGFSLLPGEDKQSVTGWNYCSW